MITIKNIEELKIPITWTLLYVGLIEKYLTTNDVIDYATCLVEQGIENEDLYELIGAYPEDKEYIFSLLRRLGKNENDKRDIEKLLFLIHVNNVFGPKQEDYIEGLIEIIDINSMLDDFIDHPFVVPGRNNNVNAKEYFTLDNYTKIYLKGKMWLEKQILRLGETTNGNSN